MNYDRYDITVGTGVFVKTSKESGFSLSISPSFVGLKTLVQAYNH
jgi:hypothetical protein